MEKRLICLIGFCLAISGVAGLADEKTKDTKTTQTEEIVVTATRSKEKVTDVPASVEVVTKEDIEKKNSLKRMEYTLNNLSGVYVGQGLGLMENVPMIGLRGTRGASRTLLMMDGIPLNDNTGQGRIAGFAPEDIEQIELVKGSFSSLYGSNAVGGVINVTTKMPDKREMTLKTGYGSSGKPNTSFDNLNTLYLSYGDKVLNNLRLFISYGTKSTNGYSPYLNVQSAQPPAGVTGWSYTKTPEGNLRYLIGDSGDYQWEDKHYTIKTRYDISNSSNISLSFMRGYFEYNYDQPHTYLSNTAGNSVWSYGSVKESSFLRAGLASRAREHNIYNINYETVIAKTNSKLSLSLVDNAELWRVTPDTTATLVGGTGVLTTWPIDQNYNADLQFILPSQNQHTITFGSFYQTGKGGTTDYNLSNWRERSSKTGLRYQSIGKHNIYALYLQDEIKLLNNLTAYLGTRQDWWKTYAGFTNEVTYNKAQHYGSRDVSALSPKASMIWHPLEDTAVRTSIGKSFRPPAVNELYWSSTSSGGSVYQGNPDLKPETNLGWELGVQQNLTKNTIGKITYFDNKMKDLIYTKSISSTLSTPMNVGEASSKGWELEAEHRFNIGVKLFANATFTNPRITENDANPSTDGKLLVDIPKRVYNIGTDFEVRRFSGSLVGKYVSKRYKNDLNTDATNGVYTSRDPYSVADTKLNYKATDNISYSLSVDNLFNRDYFDNIQSPGRAWFIEMTVKY
jgi:iron complex outermembrane receptor protein